MSGLKDDRFDKRLNTARDAKRAMAAKFLRRPGADDPAFAERQAARAAVSAARSDREAKRAAENERLAAEREAQERAAAAEQKVAAERAASEKAAKDAALEVERKAARDARYAARKARK